MEKIQNFDNVLSINGTKINPTFSEFPNEKDREYLIAVWQWEEIVKAYNKERDPSYKADWTNPSHYKYYPWTEVEKDSTQPSGFAFSRTNYRFTLALTRVGSRHAFAHRDDVLDALKKFGQIYIKTRMF